MARTKREKKDILRNCDAYFEEYQENYKVDKSDFISLISVMLENENMADHMRGKSIWKKLES